MTSWTMFHVRGIPIKAHITLLIAIPYFALVMGAQFTPMATLAGLEPAELRLPGYVWGVLLALGLFASVALHELAHVWSALRHGRTVHGITLMLLGGVSHIDHIGETKGGEGAIALVGPVMSFLLSVACYALYERISTADVRFGLFYISQLNLTIAMFNMVPAYPLDGGRVLRAVLARRMGYDRGTAAAIAVSKGFAVAFAVFGIFTMNLVLLLIAIFVYSAGQLETRLAAIKRELGDMKAEDLMHVPTARLSASLSADLALHELIVRRADALPVVQSDGRFVGLATSRELDRYNDERRQAIPVGLAARFDVPRVRPQATAVEAVEALSTSSVPLVAVVDDQARLAGLIDLDDIRLAARRRELGVEHKKAV